MSTRTQHASITFRRAFHLKGIDGQQPAGTYQVETEEELIEGLSFPAYRRVSTMIMMQNPQQAAAFVSARMVDPGELADAHERDRRDLPLTWRK